MSRYNQKKRFDSMKKAWQRKGRQQTNCPPNYVTPESFQITWEKIQEGKEEGNWFWLKK